LAEKIPLTADEVAGCEETAAIFRLGISPYYLSLIDKDHPFCPIRMQAIPVKAEARIRPGELKDPLGEDKTRPTESDRPQVPRPGAVPGDRFVLGLLPDLHAAAADEGGEAELSRTELQKGIAYVRATPSPRRADRRAATRCCCRTNGSKSCWRR